MRVRQEFLNIEDIANNQYQKTFEKDSKDYHKQEKATILNHRQRTMETMKYVKDQVPQ